MTQEQVARNIKFAEYLRNPELKQAFQALGEEDGSRCCLGHACDFFKANTGIGKWINSEEKSLSFTNDKEFNDSYVPNFVKEWFGWDTANPEITVEDKILTKASIQNDQYYKPLAKIADGFEKLGRDNETIGK